MLAKILFSVIMIFLMLPPVMVAQHKSDFQLSDYRWKNRLLLVFAPSQESTDYLDQIKELSSHNEGMLDRDLKIFHLFSDDESFGNGQQFDEKTANNVYRKFEAKPGEYTLILIGKDGTEKLRTNSVLKIEKLFGLIDSMPMRQREMRDNGRGGKIPDKK